MNPKLLQQLSTIIKYGSMSAAAERLHVTQPTLTRAIQVIEQRAGAPVLKRTSTGVEATEIGRRLARLGENIDHYAGLTNSIIEQWQAGLDTEIRIGIGPLLGMGPIDDFVQNHYRQSNKVLHFITSTASTLLRQLNRGELDFMISPINTDGDQGNLVRRAIFKDETRIFVGKQSELYGKDGMVSSEQLKQQKWVTSGVSAGFTENMDTSIFTSPSRLVFTGSIDMVFSQLTNTNACVILPYRMAMLTNRLAKEHAVQTGLNFNRRDIALWIPKSKLERPDVMDVVNQLEVYFKCLDDTSITLPPP